MTSKKINKELSKKSASELEGEAARLKKELFDIKFKHATRQLTDLMSIRKTRRDLARALTFKTQKSAAK
jgi:large subunit ribosomal protein L29